MDSFDLRIDGGTQPRERLDEATVQRYAEAMAAGLWDFARVSDPAVAFYDGSVYWLADGFHRLEAAKRAGKLDDFAACLDVRQGTQRDAILFSVGANAHHGWPRSDEDKRRAVSRLLADPEWGKWSDREIARRCCVAPTFVGKVRASLSTVGSEERTRVYTTKHGTVATMNTSGIGRTPNAAAEPVASVPPGKIAEPGTIDPPHDRIVTEPVGELTTEPVGKLRVDPSLPGRRAEASDAPDVVDAERERELFVAAIRPLIDGLMAEGRKNMATMSPCTVAHLAAQLEALLVGWDFGTYSKRAPRCSLCGERITDGKVVALADGRAHWRCQQNDEAFRRWQMADAAPDVLVAERRLDDPTITVGNMDEDPLITAANRVEACAKRIDPNDDEGRRILQNARMAIRRAEAWVAKLIERAEVKRRRKVEALVAAGGTEGERAAAADALERMTKVPMTYQPTPLPRTAEEMRARRKRR